MAPACGRHPLYRRDARDAISGETSSYVLPQGDVPFLLAAHELTPVDTMQFDASRLAGLVTELGGATSHTVILLKSLGIPAVVGVKGLAEQVQGGETGFWTDIRANL